MPLIHFIGCGRLGKTIAKLIVQNNLGIIGGVVNQSLANAEAAIQFVGQGSAYQTVNELPTADMIFIATIDEVVSDVCQQLATTDLLKNKPIVAHFSGALSSDALLSATNCPKASLHPIASFANPADVVTRFKDVICTLEGDKAACDVLKPMFQAMGANVCDIAKENKALYHPALVFGHNYMVSLHFTAVKSLLDAGFEPELAKKMVSKLMSDALRNIEATNHQSALTGPLQRGDLAVLTKHMEVLQYDPVRRNIYKTLGIGTLDLTRHNDAMKEKIRKILM